jgi:hypothetical protein
MWLDQASVKLTHLVPSSAITESSKQNTTYRITRYSPVGVKIFSRFHRLYNKMATLHEHTKLLIKSDIIWILNHCHNVRTGNVLTNNGQLETITESVALGSPLC